MSEKQAPLLDFPCDFAIKVMGRQAGDFPQQVLGLLRQHFAESDILDTRQRESRGAAYLALTVTVRARSRAQLDAAYQALNDAEYVLMTL